ncbi:MAG: hypothetical protein HY700_19315 [Gemmatimonadetes bacterium]|nr:hypothetical protein [Gemmatimonadota bacterium]
MKTQTSLIAWTLLALGAASPLRAQGTPADMLKRFMDERGLDDHEGAWFRQRRVSLADTVTVNQWITWAGNSTLTGFRQPMTVLLGIACSPPRPHAMISAKDSTWKLRMGDVWIRYAVDTAQLSAWRKANGVGADSLIVAAFDSTQSARLVKAMLSGSDQVTIRARVGTTGVGETFYFMINGFPAAYEKCATDAKAATKAKPPKAKAKT